MDENQKKILKIIIDENDSVTHDRMTDFAIYCSFHHPELLAEWGEYRRKNGDKP
jgi:hypothetical protein